MAKFVFLNIPAYGHVNPTLAVVQELVRRGEEVVYYLPEEFRATIEALGATFRPYQPFKGKPQPPVNVAEQGGESRGTTSLMALEQRRDGVFQTLERVRAEQPDYIVYDALHLWARTVAEILHVPAILSCPLFVMHEQYNPFKEHLNLLSGNVSLPLPVPPAALERIQAEINRARSLYNLPPFDMHDFYTHAEPLNIVYMPRAFHPAADLFDERFVFVGPSLLSRPDAPALPLDRLDGHAALYISLGTVFNNRPEFFQLCFDAFDEGPWQVVVSSGNRVGEADLGPAPANFLLSSYVPQLEVLQKSRVFVTHGGMNSVMESLYYGVPMVVVPQQVEQAANARRVQELGLGITLDPDDLTAEALRTAVERVYADSAIHERVRAMQQTVRAAGGYRRAVDAILHFSHTYA